MTADDSTQYFEVVMLGLGAGILVVVQAVRRFKSTSEPHQPTSRGVVETVALSSHRVWLAVVIADALVIGVYFAVAGLAFMPFLSFPLGLAVAASTRWLQAIWMLRALREPETTVFVGTSEAIAITASGARVIHAHPRAFERAALMALPTARLRTR